jgi:hypothetical protein
MATHGRRRVHVAVLASSRPRYFRRPPEVLPVHPPAGRPCRGAARATVGVTAASLALVGLPTVASAAPTMPYVSEIHYDTAGTHVGEFVEVTIPADAVPA